MNWEILLYTIVSAGLAYLLYQGIRKQPGAFSSDNIFKSLHTLGLLALMMIAFIALCVWSLKSG